MTRKPATIAVRSGLNDDEQYGCVVPPIHLSSTYNFTDFNQPRAHDYSRRGNPTRDVVQRALAELEGGAGAVMTGSGMSAIHLVTTVLLKPGDLLVAPHDCYGGSYRLFDSLSKRGAYRVLFVDQGNEAALQQALAQKPKLVLIESPSNPLLRVVDIAAICAAAHGGRVDGGGQHLPQPGPATADRTRCRSGGPFMHQIPERAFGRGGRGGDRQRSRAGGRAGLVGEQHRRDRRRVRQLSAAAWHAHAVAAHQGGAAKR